MSTVYLDGKPVAPDAVSPEKHRFIGMWRPPRCPKLRGDTVCSCGDTIRFAQETVKHYRDGCFDVPQYVSLETMKESKP